MVGLGPVEGPQYTQCVGGPQYTQCVGGPQYTQCVEGPQYTHCARESHGLRLEFSEVILSIVPSLGTRLS